MKGIPCIKRLNGIDTLVVNDEPFLVLGGETRNSSASDPEYMREVVWPAIRELHMNTLVVPVYWELIEPEEGQFDFSLVDSLIRQAAERGMHLVLLWFGLWKNSESNYVPGWMKREQELYWQVQYASGERANIVSPLCEAAVERDACAFAALMKHIREADGERHTVLFMQVENEIGILGSDRDYSAAASEKFERRIPEEIQELYHTDGTWTGVFGEDAGEFFMAYYYAKAVEKIASAGKMEYPIPYYANAWLEQYPWRKGSYPSGGPVPKVHKIWKTAAPALFCLAPDIYVPYVPQVMEGFTEGGNPLFIPEVRKDAVTAAYCLYAFGRYNAIGYSPFAIEEYGSDPSKIEKPSPELMAALNIDPSAFEIEGAGACLAASYKIMEQIKPLYLTYRGTKRLQAYVKQGEYDYGCLLNFEEVDILISHGPKQPYKPVSGGIIIEVRKNCFYLIGMMSRIEFLSKKCDGTKIGVLRYEEGAMCSGKWKPERRLNGDEGMQIKLGDKPEIRYIEVYLSGRR